ncbi:nitrate reductase molybdenum cofactor assembly chaperone [Sphaerisporangium melleum]|uniref:Nitrate reductase molybdenum cofactor assembly chaperone n=1 Tax=Sphaerisporangium melleum TaxID=321316 RepID=A0A917QYV6_9ACTN|nr:nitrate reductase molybdenum cofactor assembly chaperone [Sphaerisporangium melleum]GGK78567.1 nitrate reductase molybdenum cofactor assembly chaperone [Sphaerisporangium melleum]GII69803.1 nitrate reductase molybdenum cofactor assembly chaperone [Sphaerisporangium melleum]
MNDHGNPRGMPGRGEAAVRTVHMAASIMLDYPGERLAEALPALAATVAALPRGEAATRLAAFLDHVAATPLADLAAHYVATFDLKRRCCPYLTYYAYGDTRKRGAALLRFKHAYRTAGFEPADDELPDHLAVVCELSGRGGTGQATRLLREHRPGLEVLRQALLEEGSPYAHVVAAVLATLPEPTARERAAAARLAAQGPPEEEVGLEPFDTLADHRLAPPATGRPPGHPAEGRLPGGARR